MKKIAIFLMLILCANVSNAESIKERLRRARAQEAKQQKSAEAMKAKAVPAKVRDQVNDVSDKEKTEKVEIFITEWCPYCQKLEKFLKKEKIKYTRYDIEKSATGKRKYEDLDGAGVPLIKIGSRTIHGFNPSAILSELGN